MDKIVIVDASEYQGKIDFSILSKKAQAIRIRYGYGKYGLDSRASENVEGAKAYGMVFGGYWAIYAGLDYNAHINSFEEALERLGYGDLPPVWDCENTTYSKKIDTTNWLYKLLLISNDRFFKKPDIYTRATWWNSNVNNVSWAKLFDLWVAHYTSAKEGTIVGGNPVPWIPYGWEEPGYVMWQYSADGNMLGEEYGVSSDSIDISRFRGDSINTFNAKYGTKIKPLEEITPPPPINEIVPLKRVKITASILNIRAAETATSTDLGDLPLNSIVPVVEVNGDWYKISGWINRKYAKDL